MNHNIVSRALIAVIFVSPTLFATPDDALSVRAVSVDGEVTVNTKILIPGDKLKAGDKVITQKNGSAKLLYPDQSLIDVSPASSFVIREIASVGKITSELEFGMVRALVKKKLEGNKTFTIKTKTSVLAVRGTEFGVSVEPLDGGVFKESVVVKDGQVDVAPMGSSNMFQITPGQRYEITLDSTAGRALATETQSGGRGDSQGKVVRVSASEVKKELDQMRVPDRTFEHHIEVGNYQGGGQSASLWTGDFRFGVRGI